MALEQKTHIKKGLIIALLLIVLDIVLQLTHNKFQSWVFYANSAILLVGIIASILINNKALNGKTQFSSLFGYGFQVAGVAVCILFIYSLLSVYVVFPDSVLDIYKQSIAQAQKIPGADLAKIESEKKVAIKVISISLLSSVVMVNLAIGVVGSLIGSLIVLATKKNNI